MELLVPMSYGCMVFQISRVNSDQFIFIVEIMNRNFNVTDTSIDLFFYYDLNCRLSIFVDEWWII